MKKDFPHSVSYNRFVELQRKVGVPLVFFLKMRDLDNAPVFLLSILPTHSKLPYQKRKVA